MIQRNDPIVERLKTLLEMDRLKIVDYLLESLDIPSQEIERLWVTEAQDRYSAYINGEIKAISMEEVFAKHRLSKGGLMPPPTNS